MSQAHISSRVNRKQSLLSILVIVLGVSFLGGCSQRNDLIDRSVNPFWEKAPFQDGKSWYFGNRVVGAAPNTSVISLGDSKSGFAMERIKWEITEDHLIGYRDYAFAPGTEDGGTAGYGPDAEHLGFDGGEDGFVGEPIAIFAITGHFDRIQQYQAVTGETTNEIVENTTDRPWYEREYFRVDWSWNHAPAFNQYSLNLGAGDCADHGGSMATGYCTLTMSPVIDEASHEDPADPRRWRFDLDEGYIEITNRIFHQGTIYDLIGWSMPGFFRHFDPVASDLRMSFWRIDDESDYQPLNYPETMILKDADGNEIRDNEGYAKRTPIGDRFGYFTLFGRKAYDQLRGQTKFNEIDYLIRFNIWEEWLDDEGNEIPVADRTPKPIVWYMNARHPQTLLQASRDAGEDWNKIFKKLVVELQPGKYSGIDDESLPDMFQVVDNSCSVSNVETFLSNLDSSKVEEVTELARKDYVTREFDGTLESVVARLEALKLYDADGNFLAPSVSLTNYQNAETQALDDLERICTALEWVSADQEGDARFEYQRVGDIRFNMINGVPDYFTSGWSGLATILPDPTTGEEIHGTANMATWTVDRAAYRYNEAIDAIQGDIELTDVLSGADIRSYIEEKLETWQYQETHFENGTTGTLGDRVRDMMATEGNLREVSPSRSAARLSRVSGTDIESKVMRPQSELLLGETITNSDLERANGSFQEALLNKASPVRNIKPVQKQEDDFVRALGQLGIDPVSFVDQFVVGLASEYAGLSSQERFFKIREALYYGILTHEIGHTVSLRHNFGSSMDALNYDDKFWLIESLDTDPANARDDLINGVVTLAADFEQSEIDGFVSMLDYCAQNVANLTPETDGEKNFSLTTKQCLGTERYMVSTTMEYPGVRTTRVSGLGKYDEAAIMFGYGQLVETFDSNPSVGSYGSTTQEPWRATEKWLRYENWRDIPSQLMSSATDVKSRTYVPYSWDFTQAEDLPANTVPYRYCSDIYRDLWCAPSDYGPDFQTNQSFHEYNYYSRYFFTHFYRDRFWDIGYPTWQSGMSSDFYSMYDPTQKMQWFSYLSANDPEFPGTYLEEDLERTVYRGMNHIARVLAEPNNGPYMTQIRDRVSSFTALEDHERLQNGETLNQLRQGNSDFIVPFGWGQSCDTQALVELNLETVAEAIEQVPGNIIIDQEDLLNGAEFTYVPLGDGRPTLFDSTEFEMDDFILKYLGHAYAKDDAITMLAFPQADFPRTDWLSDPRTFAISWYKLFPDEVGKIFHDIILREYAELGGTVDADGVYHLPEVFDVDTGVPNGLASDTYVLPDLSLNHQYQALLYGAAWMTDNYDGTYDFTKALMLAMDGGLDDNAALDPSNTFQNVVSFTDPVGGHTFEALDYTPMPIAADMLRKAEVLAARYQELETCINTGVITDYCNCYTGIEIIGNNFDCRSAPVELTPGVDSGCTLEDLEDRAEAAKERYQYWIDTLYFVRQLNSMYGIGGIGG